jgi:nitrogen fixation/metabolism regulation signal transduction histidine kinase
VALLVCFFIAKNIVKPIEQLSVSASAIGKGNLDAKVPVDSRDEVGQLADALRSMAANLKQSTTSISYLEKEISDRIKAEEDLQRSESQLHAILDNIPDIAWLKDRHSRLIAVNLAVNVIHQLTSHGNRTIVNHMPEQTFALYNGHNRQYTGNGQNSRKPEDKLIKNSHKPII